MATPNTLNATEALFTFRHGDVTIIFSYKGQIGKGKVSAVALSLASPVLEQFVYPPWAPVGSAEVIGESTIVTTKENSVGETEKKSKLVTVEKKSLLSIEEMDPADKRLLQIEQHLEVQLESKDGSVGTSGNLVSNNSPETSQSKMEDESPRDPLVRSAPHKSLKIGTELDFTEDDGEALLLLLRVMHHQTTNIPKVALDFPILLSLAKLCDQYICAHLLEPWLHYWLLDEGTMWQRLGNEDYLFVAWVFRREKTFEAIVSNALKRMDLSGPVEEEMGQYAPESLISKSSTNYCMFYLV
jgi:hypothetical protein